MKPFYVQPALLALFSVSCTAFFLQTPWTTTRRMARTSCTTITRTRRLLLASQDAEEDLLDKKLMDIASKLKLEIFDLDEGIYGFESRDHRFGLEVVHTTISYSQDNPGLGLILTQVAGNNDGRGLVLVSQVSGNAVKASCPIQVGDVITGVRTTDRSFAERTTGLNYDRTVQVIGEAKEAATDNKLVLEINRLVKRARIQVIVEDELADGKSQTIEALAGENLRRLLLRKDIKLYDPKTKRFDMPFSTGDCAGEGICGTCLCRVEQGTELLNPKSDMENLITKGRPVSWRATCRTVVGADNKGGTIRISVRPQSKFEDELNPGVKSIRS